MFRFCFLLALLLSTSAFAEPVSFTREIAPLLQSQCLACHNARKAEGAFRVDSFERVSQAGESGEHGVVAKESEQSELLVRLTSSDKDLRMPKDRAPLPPVQIELVRRWIEEGASYDSEDPAAPLITIIPPPIHPAAPENYPAPLPITALAYHPQGKELYVGGYHEITIWNTEQGTLLKRIGNLDQRIYAISFSPDSERIAVACGTPGRHGEVRILRATTGELLKVIAPAGDVALAAAWNPAGDQIAVGGTDQAIHLYNTSTFAELHTFTSHSDWVFALAWNHDGTRLASASRDKTAKLFDPQTHELLATYSQHESPVQGIAFDLTGKELFSLGNQQLHRWRIAEEKALRKEGTSGDGLELIAGKESLFVATAANKIKQFRRQEGKPAGEYAGPSEACISVALHEASQQLAAGTFSGEVWIWKVGEIQPLRHFLALPGAEMRER